MKNLSDFIMRKKFSAYIKPLLKSLVVFGLVVALVLGQASDALAARGGGRIGGGSFRAPRTYVSPRTAPRGPAYPGGGFGFPFLLPFFGFGGGFGGLFSIILFIAIANFLVRSFSNATSGDEYGYGGTVTNPKVTVARLQLGLLADARELQADLNRVAQTANTGSSAGLAQVLQEATLSMLRHPEYWVYADGSASQTRLDSAEVEFNRLALMERSKFSEESVSNVNNQIKSASAAAIATVDDESALAEAPGEYIVATLIVASQGKFELPKIQSSEDVRLALSQMGSVSGDDLMALEVLWTPQAEGETLSSDEVIAAYPNLRTI
jgi:uncharacterized membrane protein